MDQHTKILVTGGTGLVGSALQWVVSNVSGDFGKASGEEWVFLSSADGDLRNYNETKSIFEKHRPDKVIHTAARVGGVFENSLRMADFVRDNLAIDQNVLRVCHELGVKKVVSCLSTCIFPDKTTYPISEGMLHDGPPHPSNYGYAYAKRMLDISSQAYRQQYGCNFTCVIPTNLYGPNDNFSEGCHFIPGVIKRVSKAKEERSSAMIVPGSGRALRQFVYSRDLARVMIWTLRNYNETDPFIISVDPEQEVSIKDAVVMVSEISGLEGAIQWDTTQTDGQLKKTADNAKMRALLGDFQFTSLEQGLKETIAWYSANQGKVRGMGPSKL
ncbi:hypothetical protein ASPWEDRAFT_176418 [Aspergillus wentii DTO 134E9]|uniref:GDP-L-fucose synthase n=1 Tax=Aspergillus wentii DTO 134E9 TaxID=1073089 RepID=A0A1L9R8X9_ASPWE|nr:uncharacterized protein ASPWEDRAFT_176418 [Aspergillus wentii DTO 134E9]KAI9926612.1 GDP-L-fucose synthase [Aspergillus wentii]OJJ31338.1 hypothetical protein ASPWEDRAFT_176418 [Aspergillus wentii DTO 134E9]